MTDPFSFRLRFAVGSAWPYRDTPVSGYEVLVRFGTGEYGSFFWSEFIKIALGPGGPPKSAVLTDNHASTRSQQERRPMAINAKGKNSIFAPMAPDVKDALVKLIRSLKPVRIESFVPSPPRRRRERGGV